MTYGMKSLVFTVLTALLAACASPSPQLMRGVKHEAEVGGSRFTIWQKGETIRDRFSSGFTNEKVTLPDEKAGTLMVFKTYDRMSYALVMEATSVIHVLDLVRNPT